MALPRRGFTGGTYGANDLSATVAMTPRPHYVGTTPAENRPRVLGGRDQGGVAFPPTLGELQASTLSSPATGPASGSSGAPAPAADSGCNGCG